jgi:ribosomal protein L16 Arg81 hydroxylase
MIGSCVEGIVAEMVAKGFSTEESTREIQAAVDSPYVKGAEWLQNRLAKREWLLSVYRKNSRLHPQSGEIPRRHRLSREEFLREYYVPNRPVVMTGLMDDWPAMSKWNLDYLGRTFADRIVEVQMGRSGNSNYEEEKEKCLTQIRFGEYIEKVRTAGESNDFYLTAYNNSSNMRALNELWDDIVQIPEYLTDDRTGGFLWIGPKGTITPFHHDLTNNFMAQVIGSKRVKIAPSWDLPLMRNHAHCYCSVDGRVEPVSAHPPLDQPQIMEAILNPGEVLFLPIGCLHYVEGLEISVTVSFTNFLYNDNDYVSFYKTFRNV